MDSSLTYRISCLISNLLSGHIAVVPRERSSDTVPRVVHRRHDSSHANTPRGHRQDARSSRHRQADLHNRARCHPTDLRRGESHTFRRVSDVFTTEFHYMFLVYSTISLHVSNIFTTAFHYSVSDVCPTAFHFMFPMYSQQKFTTRVGCTHNSISLIVSDVFTRAARHLHKYISIKTVSDEAKILSE